MHPARSPFEQLEVAWEVERDSLMESCRTNPNPGWRPWAWWRFDVGEDQPRDRNAETRRLAELGELTDDELAALGEQAAEAKTRVGTPAEYISAPNTSHERWVDREAVELYEAVTPARASTK